MQKNPEVGICGPKIYFAKGFEYHKEVYTAKEKGNVFWYAGGIVDWKNVLISHFGVDEVDSGQYESIRDTDFVSGCAMMVRSGVFEKVGFLDEKFAMYLEDLDFCLRAKNSGFKVVYAPVKTVWHKNAQSSSVGSQTQDYYVTRNRLLFAVKYAKTRAKLAVLRESIKLLFTGRPGQKQGVKDFYLGRFGVKNIV
jgi:GT2 family glycosyltransferase